LITSMSDSPITQNKDKQNAVVGVGDLAVSNKATDMLSTYALGSCIAIVAYDSQAKAGGIIHFMLPDSSLSPQKAQGQPTMFADTGIPMLFRTLVGLSAERERIKTFVAGGASVITGSDMFKIGERNILAAKKVMSALAVSVVKADIGGVSNRTLHLDIATGEVLLKTTRGTAKIDLA